MAPTLFPLGLFHLRSMCVAGILKDVPDFPLVMVYNRESNTKRMALFPSLDYKGLYTVLIQLLEVAPLIQTGVDGMCTIDFWDFVGPIIHWTGSLSLLNIRRPIGQLSLSLI